MIVVIPVCDEPDICRTLNSLAGCHQPSCAVEVLVVINHSEKSQRSVVEQNEKTYRELLSLTALSAFPFSLKVIFAGALPSKHAGVGWARKIGLDEGVRHFNRLDRPDGLLISLDADTLVSPAYFEIIEAAFDEFHPPGITLAFKHRMDELTSVRQREGIFFYEAYLHYYRSALAYCGYPHAIYTIGSAFAVRADAYVKVGGMSRRQAGEDFYFLHKLTQLGIVRHSPQLCVFPSARISNRVPFGTGPAIKKWMEGDESLRYTYCLQAFCDLKYLFDSLAEWWSTRNQTLITEKHALAVQIFWKQGNWDDELKNIVFNCSSFLNFKKRFFQKFSAFQVIRFLNESHDYFYQREPLSEAIARLGKYDAELVAWVKGFPKKN